MASEVEFKDTFHGWAEAFQIFAKYAPTERAEVAVEHDLIWSGIDDDSLISADDRAKLVELGWHYDDQYESWYRNV